MNRTKRIARFLLIIAGAMLYLIALAYLYGRPEVGVLVSRIVPAPALRDTGEAGCKQERANISEEAIRQQVEKNQRMLQGGQKR